MSTRPTSRIDATSYYIDDLKKTIESVGAENIAALIAEPMNGSSGGAIMAPAGLLGTGAENPERQWHFTHYG